ncbi:uncharacterized protein LOC106150920 [Lingula anatina]|uniref:Uncharacterized protein LOC106150920 n=1 Tax=Lingula anatina TaxID=7574 RepID=A0A1S3H0E0_LINAN|nr:uncharacterized protein LOC106150920 [Lingula anatina]|eukprot:XP_013379402.1 uncharacterized protein LOC106150920 [Lingula anatina]
MAAVVILIVLGVVRFSTVHSSLIPGSATVHCSAMPNKTSVSDEVNCVECFFPDNCIENNLCKPGTTGLTCEQCAQPGDGEPGYHRLGCACVLCSPVPWSAVCGVVVLLSVIVRIEMHGFTLSLVVKLKLLLHFLHLILLSLSIKIAWPSLLLDTFTNFTFAWLSSKMITLECYFPIPRMTTIYLEWWSVIGMLCIALVTSVLIDKKLKHKIDIGFVPDGKRMVSLWTKRRTVRRSALLIFSIFYTPLIFMSIKSFACSGDLEPLLNYTYDVFLYDQAQSCEDFSFQIFYFISAGCVVVVGFLVPAAIAFITLCLRKWDSLNKNMVKDGYVYEAYSRTFCFWESVPFFRKLMCIIITDVNPVKPFIQAIVHLSLTLAYTITVIAGRPYRACRWTFSSQLRIVEIHNGFEIFSNMAVALLQLYPVLQLTGLLPPYYDVCVVAVSVLVLVVWVCMLALIPFEEKMEEAEVYEIPPQDVQPSRKPFEFWKRNKAGEVVTLTELQQRERALDF